MSNFVTECQQNFKSNASGTFSIHVVYKKNGIVEKTFDIDCDTFSRGESVVVGYTRYQPHFLLMIAGGKEFVNGEHHVPSESGEFYIQFLDEDNYVEFAPGQGVVNLVNVTDTKAEGSYKLTVTYLDKEYDLSGEFNVTL